MKHVSNRMLNYLEPQMYAKFTMLANQKGCVNLGQGFPNFAPPQFLREALSEEALTEQLQYTMTAGHPKLLNSAASFFYKRMGLQINIEKEIVVSSGAQSVLCCLMQGILNPNDEVIVFDPAFDLYRPLIEFSGGKHIGIPIKPKVLNNKEMMLKRYSNGQFIYSNDDEWEIDFTHLEQVINQKTKLIILNSPMNPIGKYIFKFIFEYLRMRNIINQQKSQKNTQKQLFVRMLHIIIQHFRIMNLSYILGVSLIQNQKRNLFVQ
ncbi:unnamed protein product [Paramecium primaurelia]|uniref:Aminotransferase class I/classII large domain-containing protein n=1 Tax=Paramecium primaurelia TaxID=5886 RepID=A0A8S1PH91_PARPR|nr:unnamed protein product [Paramecium primaurelia]